MGCVGVLGGIGLPGRGMGKGEEGKKVRTRRCDSESRNGKGGPECGRRAFG